MNKNPTPPEEQEELVHTDDAIIGKASRWSLLAGAAILVLVIVIVFIVKLKPAPPPPRITKIDAPIAPARPQTEVPGARFADITREAGITFVHNTGAYGEKLLPETMGGGVAFFDFDSDGDPDLLFVNSTYWPGHVPEGSKPTAAALYRNDGRGRFEDVTSGSGLDVSIYGMGAAVGDYDNDGKVDVFITAVGGNHLFHNESNGQFRDVTAQSGVAGATNAWSTCAAWL